MIIFDECCKHNEHGPIATLYLHYNVEYIIMLNSNRQNMRITEKKILKKNIYVYKPNAQHINVQAKSK